MNYSIFLGCFWVLASTVVALLPMRHQYRPGMILFLSAPIGILWIGHDFGWGYAALGLFAFVSMFRRPLRYFYRRARGETPEIPK